MLTCLQLQDRKLVKKVKKPKKQPVSEPEPQKAEPEQKKQKLSEPDDSEPETEVAPASCTSGDATFASLGVTDTLCKQLDAIGWKKPTDIQREALPPALAG